MPSRSDEIFYFTTAKGLVAVSIDECETITLPSGKTMRPTAAWEESSVDLFNQLNDAQRQIVEKSLVSPPLTEMEEIVAKLRKSTKASDAQKAPPEPEMPDVPLDSLVVVSDLLD